MKYRNNLRRILRKNFDRIEISKRFQNSPPKDKKMSKKVKKYAESGKLEPIIVDENMVLIDGYCSYLLIREHNFPKQAVKIYKAKRKKCR